jgi:hypothetical protein
MGDENMIDTASSYFIIQDLDLSPFATVKKQQVVARCNNLSGGMSSMSRYG